LRRGQAHKAVRKNGTIVAETLNVKGGVQRVAKVNNQNYQNMNREVNKKRNAIISMQQWECQSKFCDMSHDHSA